MIANLNNFVNEFLGSSLALPANGLGGSRATSLLVANFALQNTKFGNEKGKVQKPARIADRTLACDFKNAFQIAEKYHAEAVSYDFTKSETWRREQDSNLRGAY